MRSSGVESLFVILGPSGAGKSSFLRAGLVPRLRREDRQFLVLDTVRPERNPLTGDRGLAARSMPCAPVWAWPPPLWATSRMPAAGGTRNNCGSGWPRPGRRPPNGCWRCQPGHRRRPWCCRWTRPRNSSAPMPAPKPPSSWNCLPGCWTTKTGPLPALIVAATIRADFYEALQTAPELAGLKSVVFDELKPMPVARFREVILGPAARATAAGQATGESSRLWWTGCWTKAFRARTPCRCSH